MVKTEVITIKVPHGKNGKEIAVDYLLVDDRYIYYKYLRKLDRTHWACLDCSEKATTVIENGVVKLETGNKHHHKFR